MKWISLVVSAGLATALCASPALAADGKKGGKKSSEKQAPKEASGDEGAAPKKTKERAAVDLETITALGSLAKGTTDTFEISFKKTEGKKSVVKKAWLKVDAGASLLIDRVVDLSAFKEGDPIKVFAKPRESEGPSPPGMSGRTRILQSGKIAIGGKDVEVNDSYKDPKDDKFLWCDVMMEKGKNVAYENGSWMLTLDKGAPVLKRDTADLKKDIKRGVKIALQASETEDKVEGDKDGKTVYKASKIIVLDARCNMYMGPIFE